MRPEEDLLKKSKTRLREEQMLRAEALRRDGMTYEYIADDMMLPVSTIKRWVSCIKPKLMADGSNPLHLPKRSAAWGGSPMLPMVGDAALNTAYGMTGEEFIEKPDSLTDEEWAVCVNNPESKNYDAFAFNPYLKEWGE
ncbi:MAG: hypothetical protein M0D57_06160 [Sphingobacteriales bacterium JAD_PAG50586_3]|nr:MAG: hypothetical protein M0D57_06160 [Sphingobacteriales bacterium JAD_PAG50586_3]